jgi:hypothetical protein
MEKFFLIKGKARGYIKKLNNYSYKIKTKILTQKK